MNLYQSIKQACKDRHISVAFLEKELGWHRGTISKWENHYPSVERVNAVAEMLGTTVDALLKGE